MIFAPLGIVQASLTLLSLISKIRLSFVHVSYILRISFVEGKVKVWLSYEEGYYRIG